MPTSDIEQIAQQPIVILMYSSGASGEFLAWALTESVSGVTKTSSYWENNVRCKYSDALGRSLNGGNDPVLVHLVVERFKIYCVNNVLATKHLALAHPDPATINFISTHFSNLDMIEITMNNEASRRFRYFASIAKITPQDIENSGTVRPWWSLHNCLSDNTGAGEIDYAAPNHLKIEWADIMLHQTAKSLDRVAQFLGGVADHDLFGSMLAEYQRRNQEIFEKV